MLFDFDRGTEGEDRISVVTAVRRGHALITRPVLGIMAGAAVAGVLSAVATGNPLFALAGVLAAPWIAWLWWSYATPRWREWALRRGANPETLQRVAEREKLVWPVGHFFERTEFRSRPK